jgi:hypothetical protein
MLDKFERVERPPLDVDERAAIDDAVRTMRAAAAVGCVLSALNTHAVMVGRLPTSLETAVSPAPHATRAGDFAEELEYLALQLWRDVSTFLTVPFPPQVQAWVKDGGDDGALRAASLVRRLEETYNTSLAVVVGALAALHPKQTREPGDPETGVPGVRNTGAVAVQLAVLALQSVIVGHAEGADTLEAAKADAVVAPIQQLALQSKAAARAAVEAVDWTVAPAVAIAAQRAVPYTDADAPDTPQHRFIKANAGDVQCVAVDPNACSYTRTGTTYAQEHWTDFKTALEQAARDRSGSLTPLPPSSELLPVALARLSALSPTLMVEGAASAIEAARPTKEGAAAAGASSATSGPQIDKGVANKDAIRECLRASISCGGAVLDNAEWLAMLLQLGPTETLAALAALAGAVPFDVPSLALPKGHAAITDPGSYVRRVLGWFKIGKSIRLHTRACHQQAPVKVAVAGAGFAVVGYDVTYHVPFTLLPGPSSDTPALVCEALWSAVWGGARIKGTKVAGGPFSRLGWLHAMLRRYKWTDVHQSVLEAVKEVLDGAGREPATADELYELMEERNPASVEGVRPYHVFLRYLILKGGLDISFVLGGGGAGGPVWNLVRMDDDLHKLVEAAAAECDRKASVVAALLLGLVSYNRVWAYLRAGEEDRAQRFDKPRHDGLVRVHGPTSAAVTVVHVSSEQLRYLADLAADEGGDIFQWVVPVSVPAAPEFKDGYTGAAAWTDGVPAEDAREGGGYAATEKLNNAVERAAKLWAAKRYRRDKSRVLAADISGEMRAVDNRLTPADVDNRLTPAERVRLSAAAAVDAEKAAKAASDELKAAETSGSDAAVVATLKQARDDAYLAEYIAVACAERDQIEADTGRVLRPSYLWPMFIDSTSRKAYPLTPRVPRRYACRHNGEDTIFLKRIHQAAVDLGWGDGERVVERVVQGRRRRLRVYERGGRWVHDFFPFFLDLLQGQPDDGTLFRSIDAALAGYCSVEPA